MNAKLSAFQIRKKYDRNIKKRTPLESKYNEHNEHNWKEHKTIKSSLISTNTQNKKSSRKFNYGQ